MTLLFAEYAKRMLSLTIAIHEFVGCLAIPSELRLLSPERFVGFVMVLLNSRIIVELASSILVAYLFDLHSQEVLEGGLLKRDLFTNMNLIIALTRAFSVRGMI